MAQFPHSGIVISLVNLQATCSGYFHPVQGCALFNMSFEVLFREFEPITQEVITRKFLYLCHKPAFPFLHCCWHVLDFLASFGLSVHLQSGAAKTIVFCHHTKGWTVLPFCRLQQIIPGADRLLGASRIGRDLSSIKEGIGRAFCQGNPGLWATRPKQHPHAKKHIFRPQPRKDHSRRAKPCAKSEGERSRNREAVAEASCLGWSCACQKPQAQGARNQNGVLFSPCGHVSCLGGDSWLPFRDEQMSLFWF